MSGALNRRFLSISALLLGSAPSFLAPVVVVQRLPTGDASTVLLVYSISMIVSGVFSNAVETTALARLSTIYANGESITQFELRALANRSLQLMAAPIVVTFAILLVVYWKLGSGLSFINLCGAGLFLIPIPLILAWCAAYSGELYARAKLPVVYISNLARGTPTLLVAFIAPHILAVSAAYLVGEFLRALLLWRNSIRGLNRNQRSATFKLQIGQMGALLISNAIAHIMPLLMQAIFAWAGPAAISQGAIALRVQAAATQITTGGLTMHNVSRFAAIAIGAKGGRRAVRSALLSEAIKVTVGAIVVSVLGLVAVLCARILLRDILSPTVLAGLAWSLVLIAAIPTVALTFWAGRGLIVAGMHRPLPVVIAAASSLSAPLGLLMVPSIGGVSALVASAVCSVITAIGYTWILFRRGPAMLTARADGTTD